MPYGVRISKDNIDATQELTETNIKDFIFVSDKNSPKVVFSGFISSGSPGVSFTHGLGKVPMFFMFSVDSVTSPTYYKAIGDYAEATTTTISHPFATKVYFVILDEGN